MTVCLLGLVTRLRGWVTDTEQLTTAWVMGDLGCLVEGNQQHLLPRHLVRKAEKGTVARVTQAVQVVAFDCHCRHV